MPIKLVVKTLRKGENDVMVIRLISLYGVLKLKYEVPYMDLILRRGKAGLLIKSELKQPDEKKVFMRLENMITSEQLKKLFKVYTLKKLQVNRAMSYMLSKLRIADLSLIYKIGAGDAALTAFICGLSWIVIGSVLSVVYNFLKVTTKDIVVAPVFDNEAFSIELGCIITLKLGHIINTGIKLLPVLLFYLKSKKQVNEHI
jgi:hypothetical protein